MIYDLIVVGNGLAAQTFLFELFTQLRTNVNKSQTFNVAQIYSEEITPSCSLRTTSTVSLNGIEEGVSELGDELSTAFKLFCDFKKEHSPNGVEEVNQYVAHTNDLHKKKMLRRYKKLEIIDCPLFDTPIEGVKLDSYVIYPGPYSEWFNEEIKIKHGTYKLDSYKEFVRSIVLTPEKNYNCTLLNSDVLKAKKIVLCTGAYSKIYAEFIALDFSNDLIKTQVVPGSFLERKVDLKRDSFYLTLDGHNLIYRSLDQCLIVGSSSSEGALLVGDHNELKTILDHFNNNLNINLGEFKDFNVCTGLRHKGVRRRPIMKPHDDDDSLFMISGFYKNGFSFGHLAALKIVNKIINQ